MIKPKHMPEGMAKPSKALLAEIEAFLNNHYEYRCQPKYKGLFGKIRAYLDRCEDEKREELRKKLQESTTVFYSDPKAKEAFEKRGKFTEKLEDTFSTGLLKLIAAKGKDPVDIYRRANIDRKLFSKIRNQERYQPSKNTAISLAVALELSLDETQALLKKAGFTLSRSILSDVIIEYFISEGKYDMFEINNALFAYKQTVLG